MPRPKTGRPVGRPPKYDWDTWLDGRTHLVPLDELTSTPPVFARVVRQHAARRGVTVRVSYSSVLGVFVQRVTPDTCVTQQLTHAEETPVQALQT